MDALKHLREMRGLSRRDATVALDERVAFLKANKAEHLTVPLGSYGQGFYS